jgi:hypothetical protein
MPGRAEHVGAVLVGQEPDDVRWRGHGPSSAEGFR